ncbi:MAG TPA: DNA polymerase/3'-5' exonuclease PolX [Egibacteraceae bacterium]|nr:DNA polymerase/3'-5' exonuclease PolX [Egibacteraceae bacterium]
MSWTNEDVAARFAEIATLLRLRGDDPFRVRAYERAAATIGAAAVDLSTLEPAEIARLKGIGTSTAKKITEYLRTGTIGMLEELRGDIPAGLLELIRVPGLGPKTARLLHDELGIDSVERLRAALDAQALRDLPGLGAKTEENLRESLARMGVKDSDRVPAADAIAVAEELVARLREVPGVTDAAYAGSLRRMRETVGDIDVLAASEDPGAVHATLRDSPLVVKVLAAGEKKTSVLTVRGLQADLRVVEPAAWGAALVYFTGSKAHNVRIRERAVRRGLTVNEYGVFDRETGERVAGSSEAEVYAALGMVEVPPPLREDTGEVEAAVAGELPRVVTIADVRGDLHGHSDWSGDGKASLVEMLDAAAARGYAYWAVTDHAEDLSINGLSRERMLAQRAEIARLADRYPTMRILHGAELNIAIDGGLDYDPEFLLGFDFTVASVHSLLRRPPAEQTARILAAMENPAVNVIGHPTGRKIGVRPGYEVDFDAIVGAAVETGTALEVNASPRRLDLGGDLVRRAVQAGAQLAISCDAHSVGDLTSLRYGVATAQRGWATPGDVLNCRDLHGLLAFVAAKRSGQGGRG